MAAWEARDETLATPGLGSTCPLREHCSTGPGTGRVTQASCGQLDRVVGDAQGTRSLRRFVHCAGPGELGFSACPDGFRNPSKTFMVLRVIL